MMRLSFARRNNFIVNFIKYLPYITGGSEGGSSQDLVVGDSLVKTEKVTWFMTDNLL